jgi:hypothetical protein
LRRALIALVLIVPALVLIGWLVSAQIPLWNVPQERWFSVSTPGICAAVDSLKLYDGQRADVGGIGRDAALADAAQVALKYYTSPPPAGAAFFLAVLGVEATLPAQQRQGYYVVVAPLSSSPLPKAAVMYLDAQTGDVKALITAIDDESATCVFNWYPALLAAVKSPPLLLLVTYGVLVVAGLVARWLLKRRGDHR